SREAPEASEQDVVVPCAIVLPRGVHAPAARGERDVALVRLAATAREPTERIIQRRVSGEGRASVATLDEGEGRLGRAGAQGRPREPESIRARRDEAGRIAEEAARAELLVR